MKYYYWLLLQILLLLMFYITKNESLSDDFILEQFEQHSERIRRLEELCNVGNLTDDLSSREFRQKVEETHKVNSISNALTLLQFSNTVYLIFQNLLVDQHRKKAATSEFFFSFNFFFTDSKILILGGTNENSTLAEIIDLKNQSIINSCLISMRSSYSTGAFTDGTPVICGGYPETTHCNIVMGQAKKFLAELSQERTYAASGVMNDGALWITGGYPGPTDTSELVMPGKNQSSM